ncbi:alpha/beta hydrolase [Rhodoferax lacus]|uniref:alpha/beta hydrolase n=1 Tax=Rhodoferax lacus TaxID=2184758 RepID=UPI001F23EAE8|nr:alpha/beta fold hydrolase [Rhodoferax lacus]
MPPLRSIGDPFKDVRFDGMPALQTFTARDGTPLAYRRYDPAGQGNGRGSVMLVHGSSGNSNSVHPLAQSFLEAGYTVYAFDIRGHGQSGVKGQVGYIGQLDDDLEDFVGAAQPARPRTLLGFSSGGGFALRVAGSPRGAQFDNFLFMAPYIHYKAMTNRSGASAAWASVGLARLVSLVLLNRVGVPTFNDLPVLNFAVAENPKADLVRQYSYALAVSFQPPDGYRAAIRSIARPAEVMAGADDELFFADQYRPLLDEAGRPDIPVTVVPATGHISLTLSPAGRAAAVAAVQRMDAPFELAWAACPVPWRSTAPGAAHTCFCVPPPARSST